MVWTTQRAFVQNPNPSCAGRRLLKDILRISGPTRLAKKNCDIVDEPWRWMVTDEALRKVVTSKLTNVVSLWPHRSQRSIKNVIQAN